MSALPSTSDLRRSTLKVRYLPTTDSCTAASPFHHLVGAKVGRLSRLTNSAVLRWIAKLSFPLEAIVGGRLPPAFEARDPMCSRCPLAGMVAPRTGRPCALKREHTTAHRETF